MSAQIDAKIVADRIRAVVATSPRRLRTTSGSACRPCTTT